LLADIRDRKQLLMAFENTHPDVVFHAAAYKHVPMLENQPWKAVKNNVKGSRNLIDFALQYAVERFVFVSTDKAVRPTNVMGASKRVAEMLVQSQTVCNNSQTRFMTVRFGNVVGSVGSVVPLFKKQIEKGGPVTVTHPEMTRYFMTIPEACQLICQAGAMGKGGEIFILDMGTSIKIDDMARDLIRLSGFEPDVDIDIEYVGIRPGEKLHEELITEGEGVVPTGHDKIMVLKGNACNLIRMNGKIDDLIKLSEGQDGEQIKAKLQSIVPEYTISQ
jgi:FlaA1/EpsC-like NDP-sugar epimerase